MQAAELIAFEKQVAEEFNAGQIQSPIHLSGGNEKQLIDIFDRVHPQDYVFSTWRNHYHALLHGIPKKKLMAEIYAGRSMNLCFPNHRFYASSIVAGCLPIAVGVAYALKRRKSKQKVWCFVGDMASMTGAFHEATYYSVGHNLPIQFVIEDNGLSTNTPTRECWGYCEEDGDADIERYQYTRVYPHYGIGKGNF